MREKLLAILFTVFVMVSAGVGTSYAQSPTTSPSPIEINPAKISDTFTQLSKSAVKFLRFMREEVEAPLNDYFFLIALALFSLVACAAFLRMKDQNDGQLSVPMVLRFIMRFGTLAFVMTVVLLACDTMLMVGNFIAYGRPSQTGNMEFRESWLGKLAHDQAETFQVSYERYLEGLFIVKVNGEPTDLTDPGDGTITLLGVNRDQGIGLAASTTQALTDTNWDPNAALQRLNWGRFAIAGGDLFNSYLPNLLLIFMRLFAPFAVAVAIDKGLAARLTWQWIWGMVALTIILPPLSQVLRIGAYLAGNMALQIGDPAPIWTWDYATMSILKTGTGDPAQLVNLAFITMLIMGGLLMASIVLAYQITLGRVYEAGSQLVAGYIFGGAATGVGLVSSAAAANVGRQAENMQIHGQASAEAHTLKGQKESADMRDTGGAVAGRAVSKSSAYQGAALAESAAVATVERARTTDARTVREVEATHERTVKESEGRVEASDVEAQNAANQQRSGMTGTIVDTLKGADRKLDQWLEGTPFGGREILRNQPWRDGEMSKRAKGGDFAGPVTNEWGAPRDYNKDGVKNEKHTGIDLGWSKGERVGSAQDGRVVFAGRDGGYGNRVVVQHPDGQLSTYSHLDSLGVSKGQAVKRGQFVGVVGNTGDSKGAHLHFETGTLRGGADGHGPPQLAKINPRESDLRPVRLGKGVPAVNPNAAMATQTGQAMRESARLREQATVNASGDHTAAMISSSEVARDEEIGIAGRQASRDVGINWTAHTMRVDGINKQLGMNHQANSVMFDAGTKAMETRRDSMLDAAALREKSSIIAASGSILAQQVGRLNESFRF